MRVQLEATELKNTDVNFVSLVKHGANRIPFRIVKGDDEMSIDLSKIGRALFRKSEAKTGVVNVLVSPEADQAVIAAALEKAGLVVTQKSEQDGMVVYAQPGIEAGARDGLLRLNPDVVLQVSGLADLPQRMQKDFSSYDGSSTNFLAVLNTESFYPSLMLSLDALGDTVSNIMSDASDAGSAADLVGTAFDDAKAYVTGCIRGIPVRAFKSEIAIRKAVEVIIAGVKNTDPSMPGQAPGNQTAASGSGVGAGANPNGTGYDPAEDLVRATKEGEAPIGVGTRQETSPVTSNQGGAGAGTGHGGKNAITGVGGGDGPIGVNTTDEPSPVNNDQGTPRPTGHGGKMGLPGVAAGEAPIGTNVVAEPSPVNRDQGGADLPDGHGGKMAIADLAKSLEDFMGSIHQEIRGIRQDVAAQGARLGVFDTRMKKHDEMLSGTALGDAPEDPARPDRATKGDGPPPLLDTGISRIRRGA